jgi:hypothetical protein
MVHCGELADGAWLPGLQAAGTTTPVPHAKPGSHLVHSPLLANAVLLEYVPAVHGSGAAAPCLQK